MQSTGQGERWVYCSTLNGLLTCCDQPSTHAPGTPSTGANIRGCLLVLLLPLQLALTQPCHCPKQVELEDVMNPERDQTWLPSWARAEIVFG